MITSVGQEPQATSLTPPPSGNLPRGDNCPGGWGGLATHPLGGNEGEKWRGPGKKALHGGMVGGAGGPPGQQTRWRATALYCLHASVVPGGGPRPAPPPLLERVYPCIPGTPLCLNSPPPFPKIIRIAGVCGVPGVGRSAGPRAPGSSSCGWRGRRPRWPPAAPAPRPPCTRWARTAPPGRGPRGGRGTGGAVGEEDRHPVLLLLLRRVAPAGPLTRRSGPVTRPPYT